MMSKRHHVNGKVKGEEAPSACTRANLLPVTTSATRAPYQSTEGRRLRSGRKLPANILRELYALRVRGESVSGIARTLNLSRLTVRRYLRKPSTAMMPVESGPPPTPAETPTSSVIRNPAAQAEQNLALIDVVQDHLLKLAKDGALPTSVTARNVKDLTDARVSLLRLPLDVGRAHKSIYVQLGERDLGGADDADELAECGLLELPSETGKRDGDDEGTV